MALEAIKNISGARQLTRTLRREFETISDYASPSFDRIISGSGGKPSDRVSRMLMKKERLQEKLSTMLDLCLYFEEAVQAELETIDNLEFKALVIDRFIHDKPWTDIAQDYDGNISADALKKRFERCLKAYTDQNPVVHYSPNAKQAITWYRTRFHAAGIASTRELKKTSVDIYIEREQQAQLQIIDSLNATQSAGGGDMACMT